MHATLFLATGFFFLLDQLTKELLARRLPKGQAICFGGWIRIRCVAQVRAGFALRNPRARLLAWGLLLASISLIVRQGNFFQSQAAQLGLGMALGGAFGNVCDQLRSGAVTDFVELSCWPIFNSADVSIAIGVLTALWFLR
jgi:lipoprotein signal peptidase